MNVDEYIYSQPEEIHEILISVRNIMARTLQFAEERVSWGMPTYWYVHNIIHFAASKRHLGIYPGPEAVVEFTPELDEKGYKHSKGAIQFPYEKVDLELITRIAEWCGTHNK